MSLKFPFIYERWMYIKKSFQNFGQTGSITPSSKHLAKCLAKQIQYAKLKKDGGYVVELGPGSGSTTQELIDKVGYEKLFVVEIDEYFHNYIKNKFPNLNLFKGDASNLENILPQQVVGNISTIISTIPLNNLPEKIKEKIITSVFKVLSKNGNFVQVSYRLYSPIKKIAQKMSLVTKKCALVWLNVPPTLVLEFKQKAIKK